MKTMTFIHKLRYYFIVLICVVGFCFSAFAENVPQANTQMKLSQGGLLQEKIVQRKTEESRRILVVHSYHEGQRNHVGMMQTGVDNVLFDSGLEVKHFYMDTKRDSSIEWKKIAGTLALDIVKSWKPALVIAFDDNAQQYFAKFLAGKKNAPLVVFSGVNADPAKYGYPAANVTGVLEVPNIEESISLLLKLDSRKIKKIMFISDDSATASFFHAYVKTMNLPVEVVASKQVKTLKEWQQTINEYKDKVDAIGVYVSRTVKRVAGKSETVSEAELVNYINKTTSLPTVGFVDSAAEAGLLCGVSVSMEEQGREAAIIALDLLEGKKRVEDIEIMPTRRGRIQLNLKVADEKKIMIPYNIIRRAKMVIK